LVTRVSTQFWLVGKYGYALQEKVHLWPWAETTRHFEAGIAEPSLALGYIEKNKNLDVARDALGIMYSLESTVLRLPSCALLA